MAPCVPEGGLRCVSAGQAMFIWWRPTVLRSRMPEDPGHRTVGDAHRHVSCATLLDHARPHVHLVAHREGDVARSPVYAQVGPWVFGGTPRLRPRSRGAAPQGRPALHPSGCSRMPHLFPSVFATDPVLQDADQSRLLLSIAAGQVRFLQGSTYGVEGDHPSPPLPPREGPHPQNPAGGVLRRTRASVLTPSCLAGRPRLAERTGR